MKNKISLLLLCAGMLFCSVVNGQTFNAVTPPQSPLNSLEPYGHQAFNYITGQPCVITLNTVTPVPAGKKDTLVIPSTGSGGYDSTVMYLQFKSLNELNAIFDLQLTSLTGTLAGTAILQGSVDNAHWNTLTGVTTYCAGCQGASAPLTGSGTTHYFFGMTTPSMGWPFYQFRCTVTGTCTATASAIMGYKQ